MRHSIGRAIAAMALGASLLGSGCTNAPGASISPGLSGETASTPAKALDPHPADWRAKVAASIKASWKDPASIRDAQVAAPVPESAPADIARIVGQRWVVCVSLNAKNSFGGYAGRTMYHIPIKDGQILPAHPASEMGPTCGGAKLAPFPEVNGRG